MFIIKFQLIRQMVIFLDNFINLEKYVDMTKKGTKPG